jgi:serpin B
VGGSTAPVELASSELARAQPTAPDEDLRSVAAAINAFAVDMYRQWKKPNANVALSPYSVAFALTMSEAGARGETAQELRRALHLAIAGNRVHEVLNALDHAITQPAPSPEGTKAPELMLANSLWGQAGYSFRSDFLDLLAQNYGAVMRLVNFEEDPEAARAAVNAWSERATKGRIHDVIPPGVINVMTRLVLANAVYFKAQWVRQFSPEDTRESSFTTLDGRTNRVPTMIQSGHKFAYKAGDGYQVAELAYWGGYTMTAILPARGTFRAFEDGFTPARLDAVLNGLREAQLDLQMPKFAFDSAASLKAALEALGVANAFVPPTRDGGADFTGMTDARELFLRDVLHKVFVSVDEHGTEAAAATAAVFERTSGAPPALMHLDRPFLFLIRHQATGTVLFMGRVTDPAS